MPWTDHWTPGDRMLHRVVALQRYVYLRTGGRVFGRGRGKPILLLTTTGRRSGEARTTPLPYFPDADAMVVVGSNSGHRSHPNWYLNIEADPGVTVQVGPNVSAAEATPVSGADRSALWDRLIDTAPWYADYQSQARRELPIVAIIPDAPLRHDAPTLVERPALGWWVSILSGMTLLGLIAFNGLTWRTWSEHVTGVIPQGFLRVLFGAAVVTHVAEGAAAVRMAESDGRHAASLGWGAQTLLLGFPSLGLLRKSVAARVRALP